MSDKLTPQQERFVQEYLIDLNAGRAAIRAGYSENSAFQQGHRLLKNAYVSEAIEEARKKRGDLMEVKANRVVRELMRIAFSDIRAVTRWDADKLENVDSDELDDDTSAAIQEVVDKTTITRSGRNGENETERREQRIKMHDKLRALEMLSRHLGLFKDAAPGGSGLTMTLEQARAILMGDFAMKPDEKVEVPEL